MTSGSSIRISPNAGDTAHELCDRDAGAEAGAIPANVSESMRPTLMAGLAKLVELVKPVSGADVGADRGRGGRRPLRTRAKMRRAAAEHRDHLGEEIAGLAR